MARKDYMKLALVIALVASATSAYAVSTITSSMALGGGSFSPSNKVTIVVNSTTTAYAATSQHAAGDRQIATNSQEPKIWYKTVTVGKDAAAIATSDVLDSNAWTSL